MGTKHKASKSAEVANYRSKTFRFSDYPTIRQLEEMTEEMRLDSYGANAHVLAVVNLPHPLKTDNTFYVKFVVSESD